MEEGRRTDPTDQLWREGGPDGDATSLHRDDRSDRLEPDLIDAIGAGLLGRYYGVVYDPVGLVGPAAATSEVEDDEVIDLRTPRPRRSREVRARWRGFRSYWNGHALSMVGDHLTLVALPLAAERLTNSGLAVGMVVFAETLSTVLFGVIAGTFTDRRRSRPVMIAADVGRAAVLLGLVVLDRIGDYPVALLILASFLLGLMRLAFDGANSAFVAKLVPDELDVRSNNRLVLAENLGSTIGPVLAGAIISIGLWVAFAVDSVTFLLSALAIAQVGRVLRAGGITLDEPVRGAPRPESDVPRKSFRAEAAESLRLVGSRPVFRRALVLAAAFNLAALPVGQQFVTLAVQTLDLSPLAIGVMFAIGGIAGILVAPLIERDPTIRPGLLPAATGALGAGIFAVGVAPSVWTVAAAFVVGGVAFAVFMTHWAALRQRAFAPEEQGRVTLTSRAVMWSTVLVGSLAAGQLSDSISPQAMWLACGAVGMAAAVWGLLLGLHRDTFE